MGEVPLWKVNLRMVRHPGAAVGSGPSTRGEKRSYFKCGVVNVYGICHEALLLRRARDQNA